MKTHLTTAIVAALGIAAAPVFAQQSTTTTDPATQATPSAGAAGGMHDSATIRQVQQQLKDKGHEVTVDGVMGPQTQAALREYQQKEGLDATGQLDQRTLAALGVSASGDSGSNPSAAPGSSSGSTGSGTTGSGTTGSGTTTSPGTTTAPGAGGAGTTPTR